MKTKKKGLHPKLHGGAQGRLPSFGTQFLRGGGGHDGILWSRSRFLLTDSRMKTKKGICRKILGFVVMFTRIFDLQRKFTYAWRGTGPEKQSSGTGPVTLFCGTMVQSSLRLQQLLAWGHKQQLGEHNPEMPPGAMPDSASLKTLGFEISWHQKRINDSAKFFAEYC